MKEILHNEFVSISYDELSNAIITIWKKPVTSETYQIIFNIILEKLDALSADAYVSDIYRQGIVSTENRRWLQAEVLPKAISKGLRKICTIAPNDIFSRFHIENIKNGALLNAEDIEFRYFQDLISAQAWLINEEIPA